MILLRNTHTTESRKNVIEFPQRMLLPGLSSQVLGNCLKQKYNDVSDDADPMLIKASDRVNENPTVGINRRIETFGFSHFMQGESTVPLTQELC